MKILSRISLIITALFIASCGSSDSPKVVAEKYLDAIGSYDFDGAKKYGTEETVKLLDMMAGFSKMVHDSTKTVTKYNVIDVKLDGDNATAIYKEEGLDTESRLSLQRIDGKWKVNMTKESISGMEEADAMDIGATNTDGELDSQ
ncbi:MAG: DUF4878 domain-containing protein [Bacteroidetes bacterium]|nr:MAG: DUF4878 domain-containing protein [Bacteroidota bacterium]